MSNSCKWRRAQPLQAHCANHPKLHSLAIPLKRKTELRRTVHRHLFKITQERRARYLFAQIQIIQIDSQGIDKAGVDHGAILLQSRRNGMLIAFLPRSHFVLTPT